MTCCCMPHCRRVDLLKINAERGEMDVLVGIQARHWPCIRQVSMQLHDISGRLQEAKALLAAAGFDAVHAAKEARFADCCLWMVYATRSSKAPEAEEQGARMGG